MNILAAETTVNIIKKSLKKSELTAGQLDNIARDAYQLCAKFMPGYSFEDFYQHLFCAQGLVEVSFDIYYCGNSCVGFDSFRFFKAIISGKQYTVIWPSIYRDRNFRGKFNYFSFFIRSLIQAKKEYNSCELVVLSLAVNPILFHAFHETVWGAFPKVSQKLEPEQVELHMGIFDALKIAHDKSHPFAELLPTQVQDKTSRAKQRAQDPIMQFHAFHTKGKSNTALISHAKVTWGSIAMTSLNTLFYIAKRKIACEQKHTNLSCSKYNSKINNKSHFKTI